LSLKITYNEQSTKKVSSFFVRHSLPPEKETFARKNASQKLHFFGGIDGDAGSLASKLAVDLRGQLRLARVAKSAKRAQLEAKVDRKSSRSQPEQVEDQKV